MRHTSHWPPARRHAYFYITSHTASSRPPPGPCRDTPDGPVWRGRRHSTLLDIITISRLSDQTHLDTTSSTSKLYYAKYTIYYILNTISHISCTAHNILSLVCYITGMAGHREGAVGGLPGRGNQRSRGDPAADRAEPRATAPALQQR